MLLALRRTLRPSGALRFGLVCGCTMSRALLRLADGGLLMDAFVSEQVVATQPWLVCGGYNELIGDSVVETCLDAFGGVAMSSGEPTRWDDRCIDWLVTNRPRAVTTPSLLRVVLSDHIPFECILRQVPHVAQLGQLRATAQLERPAGVNPSD